LTSKPAATVFSGLASKPVVTVSLGLASKLVATVSQFGPQNRQLQFADLSLKITAADFWFGPQKPSRFQFVSCITKPMEEGRRMTHVEI
jgi:hypothetical protein